LVKTILLGQSVHHANTVQAGSVGAVAMQEQEKEEEAKFTTIQIRMAGK
jgi:hypothetical protein